MTILTTGAYDLPAAADRNRTSMMLAAGTGSLAVIDGVHSGLSLTKTTGMGFSIGPGRAAVNGASSAEGTFTVAVTASETGAFAAGDAVKDRIDLVVLKTYPNNPSATGAKVEVVQGALPSSGEPVVPSTPAGALALFQVRINAGVSAGNGGWSTTQVTDVRRTIGVPAFIDYTPTFGGFMNLGTGAVREGRYRLDGDKCSVNVHLRGGAGAGMGAANALYFTLPIPAASPWIYYGTGGLMHTTGIWDLKVVSGGNTAIMWGLGANGNVVQPGTLSYPFGDGTDIYCNMEYVIDLA